MGEGYSGGPVVFGGAVRPARAAPPASAWPPGGGVAGRPGAPGRAPRPGYSAGSITSDTPGCGENRVATSARVSGSTT